MAKIKVTIYNDLGEEIGVQEKNLGSTLTNLDDIETEVELFRQSVLPEISKVLLCEMQATFKKSCD